LCSPSQFKKQYQEVADDMMSRDPAALFPDAPSPECFQPQALPPELRMAESGDTRSLQNGTRYELSGGSQVVLYRWPGHEGYGALVSLQGEYPELGMVARNVGRTERITLIQGTASIELNGSSCQMRIGSYAVVGEGVRYRIEGRGQLVVAVSDKAGGATIIEARK